MVRAFGDPPVFAQVNGDWPPDVVALHGWGRDRSDFRAALDGLSAAAVDLPGFGASPAPPGPWGSREYAQRVAAVLDEAGGPVVLVGHSFGARVAVRLAVLVPDAVRALVLTGAPIASSDRPRRKPALSYRFVRWLHRLGVVGEERMEAARRRHGSADYRQASGVMRAVLVKVLQEDYEGDLRRIAAPVTLVWGEDDGEVPLAVAERACDLLSACRLETVAGAGHNLPLQAPDRLRAAIVDSLDTPVAT